MLPKINTILYTTGLGEGAPHVFRYALSLAQAHQAKIAIVHAMEPLSPFGQSLVELHITHEKSEQMHKQAQERVKGDIVKRLELLCEKELCNDPEGRSRVTDILVDEGHPPLVILEEAKRLKADLIVMGTHRHTRLGEALLGNTAQKVIHSSTTPVLLVRIPEGFHEEGF
ncbi:universal stress protein [Desulfuromonas versatilis]|uniref:Universal stress protein n=1 Tax=Desulfuromonas versatilis TaxID=2802975 RepID=A0ABM8HSU5_9BACT|nr:universal stress protein [Desulfuromonas versatilis]BCR03526.1 universal stress protein [Desulfuromonas versatilis]